MKAVFRVAAGVALLVVTLAIVGPESLARSLGMVDIPVFLGALAISTTSNLVSAWRWSRIAAALNLQAPPERLVPMYGRAMTSNTILPGATLSGDMLRAFELSRLGNPLLESTASVMLDRFSGLWTLCVLSFAAAAIAWAQGLALDIGSHGRHVLASYGTLLGAIVAFPFVPWPLERLARWRSQAARRIADLWQRIRDKDTGLRQRLVRTLGLSLVVQLLSGLAFVVCGVSLGVAVPVTLMLAAAAPIFVMAELPIGVAGFGTRELAAVGVLGVMGVGPELAAATGFLYGVLGVAQGVLAAPLFLLRR